MTAKGSSVIYTPSINLNERSKMKYHNFEEMPMFITIPQTAELLGVSAPSLYKLISEDASFPVVTIGKRKTIPTEQLKAWVEKNCTRNL